MLGGFAGLRHEIREIRLHRGRGRDGLRNPFHQKMRDHAGVQRSRPQRDQIGLGDRFERLLQRARPARAQLHPLDRPDAAADARLPAHFLVRPTSVASSRHVRRRGRVDPSAHRQHFRGEFHGVREVAGQMGHGHEKQVSEAVSLESPAAGETIVEQPRKERLILAQRHHAVADIARAAGHRNRAAAVRNCRRRPSP